MRKSTQSLGPALRWLALAAHVGACAENSDGTDGDRLAADAAGAQHHAGSHDAAVEEDEDGGDEAEVPCTADYPSFRDGLAASKSDLSIRVLTVEPNPPRQKVDNDWVIQVANAAGMPVTDATIPSADSYMVVHNHYGRHRPTIEQLPEPGQFKLDNIDFRMRGPWQVIVNVKTADGKTVSPALQICVE